MIVFFLSMNSNSNFVVITTIESLTKWVYSLVNILYFFKVDVT